MLPFKTLIQTDKTLKLPVYQQIANRLIGLIQEGILKPGLYLPGSRVLALQLALHRKTVIAAYDELVSQDWLVAVPRKGVMVAGNLPVIRPRTYRGAVSPYEDAAAFSFHQVPSITLASVKPVTGALVVNDGFPDARLAPLTDWVKECRSVIESPRYHKLLMYGGATGLESLRKQMMEYLSDTRGLNISLPHIMITRGAQMAIYLAAALLIKKDDLVIVGSPNYFFADLCFEQRGAQLLRVPVDEEGIDVDMIEQLCSKRKIKMLYLITHHHHPTTVTLSAARRMKLLAVIRKYKLPVIEDDYDYDFHYSSAPILPLASADHGGNVIYIGSFTKSLGLSIRIGFMIAPADFIKAAADLRRLMDLRGDNLSEQALANLFEDGTIDRHLKKSNKIYKERRDLLCHLLRTKLGDAVKFTVPSGGMAIWLRFSKKYPLKKIAAKAAALGLQMTSGEQYHYGASSQNALRLGFASLNNKEIAAVVGTLEKVLFY
ncbi:GntR family transcriptional regulator / MocR family aminotransferase [Chitinophaga ginsengisegetis]|uniref:GntR family transcriptional regulator / MocR family aminotransferase n=1 Tax=Chitinophaga ginsengisegetis TaxID=393003 RepID=A0A1T5NWQ3_9BACT|nr:PLP-dependent aminotransferase family protein [Chitinophaga ginsengisegetis]SKD04549.1 GntR family transcriptional regulator / MocR family aminotransferase [Chitinophaga ginsengisegetis]